MILPTRSPVPMGTVLLLTMTSGISSLMRARPGAFLAMSRAAARTYCMSAEPSGDSGVPTAMNTNSAPSRASSYDVVNVRRPARILRWIISSSPGS